MVQDTSPSPEFYLAEMPGSRCGGWGLSESEYGSGQEISFQPASLQDRSILWVVSVPGESQASILLSEAGE